jgi:hypothetical protein
MLPRILLGHLLTEHCRKIPSIICKIYINKIKNTPITEKQVSQSFTATSPAPLLISPEVLLDVEGAAAGGGIASTALLAGQ